MSPANDIILTGDLLTALNTLITAAIGCAFAVLSRKLTSVKDKIDSSHTLAKQTKEQVTNDHPTNLRDDLDQMREEVNATRAMLAGAIATLEAFIQEERRERKAIKQRLATLETRADINSMYF